MATGVADTINVESADTVPGIALKKDFSIGSIIPLDTDNTLRNGEHSSLTGLVRGYIPAGDRVDGQPLPVSPVSTDFSFILLSVLLLILTVLVVAGRKSIISGFSYLSFKRQTPQLPPGTSEVLSWEAIFKNVFSVVSIGFFAAVSLIYTGLISYDHTTGSMVLTAIISGSFLAALLLRHFVCILTAALSGWKNAFREYMNVVYNGWFVSAVILFILNSVILFSPLRNALPVIITGLAFTAIMLIIRTLRLLVIFHIRHISILYFILYLCALEVLPVLVLIKIIGVF